MGVERNEKTVIVRYGLGEGIDIKRVVTETETFPDLVVARRRNVIRQKLNAAGTYVGTSLMLVGSVAGATEVTVFEDTPHRILGFLLIASSLAGGLGILGSFGGREMRASEQIEAIDKDIKAKKDEADRLAGILQSPLVTHIRTGYLRKG